MDEAPAGAAVGVSAAVESESRRRWRARREGGGVLGAMRVRKKVLVLHTLFSLGLALVLLVPLRPAITEVVEQAEANEARLVLRLVQSEAAASGPAERAALIERWARQLPEGSVRYGTLDELGMSAAAAAQARQSPGQPVTTFVNGAQIVAAADEGGGAWSVALKIPEARRAVLELYGLTAAALLAVYALVAAALELFVLPQHVYGPIQRMIDADRAVQEGAVEEELIPEAAIPADELGELMRSRNQAIRSLRSHERALAEALAELERAANDMKKKNHLLEAAQRNLADADRLASLGMMSAGIAHELNTPLAVVKGLAERVNADPERRLDPASAALLLRVVSRLERLGESLLDFARVRPPRVSEVGVKGMIDEAFTLVRLDRDVSRITLVNAVADELTLECDGDRMVQVLVNLVRNAADAIGAKRQGGERGSWQPAPRGEGEAERVGGTIRVDAATVCKDGRDWVVLTVADDGPGIASEVLSRMFEPFASTKLDAHGTGLGLAVAEGIVREHGGLILARNRAGGGGSGAEFEIMLPRRAGVGLSEEGTEARRHDCTEGVAGRGEGVSA